MSSTILSSTILLFFVFYASVSKCWDLEEATQKVEQLIDTKSLRTPRDTEDLSPIWLEYEFNTGAGNREELIVTDISVDEYTNLPQTGTNWQFVEANGTGYLIRSEKSTLSFHKLDLDNILIGDPVNLSIKGVISTFKVISLNTIRSTVSKPETDLVAVLCVESDSGTSLEWYRLLDGKSFQFFWSWPVQKHIKDIEFVQVGNGNKLLLLDEDELRFSNMYSPIDIYGFSIDFPNNASHFWLCQRTLVPRVFEIQVCSIYESILLVLQGVSDVFLYEYKNITTSSIFQELQRIKSHDLKNFVCFESGYLQFLAISGPEAGLFHFFEGEFQYNTESDSNFDISEISWVRDIRLDTYRDESLLLIQLRNSTVIALAWQGLSFKRIQLPSNVLDEFDLSMVTVIPKIGFVFGNRFVRLHTNLKNLKHPIQHNTERLLTLQQLLNDTLNYQERIINETESRLEKSYLKNSEITGLWNVSEVNATNAVITNDVIYYSVTIGSANLTREELGFNATSYSEALKNLEQKLGEVDVNLIGTLDSNSTELSFDSEVEVFGNINVTGILNVEDLTVESINDVNVLSDFQAVDESGVIEDRNAFSSMETENLTVHSLNGIPVEEIRFSDSIGDYGEIDFSKIERAEVKGHLFFDMINGVEWASLIRSIVWKNKPAVIFGDTVIEGTLIADALDIDFLNDLPYPEDYVSMNSDTVVVDITGPKSFDELVVLKLKQANTINGIGIEDFVILDKENVLNKEITFENLTIDGVLQVDGEITGLEKKVDKLLNETSQVSSNIIFSNLTVLGNVTFENLFVKQRPLNLNDLLLKTDQNVEIIGKKTFLGNVGFKSNVTITSGMINGHFMDEFATLDTDQQFPMSLSPAWFTDLIKISPNVTFGNVIFGAVRKLETLLNPNENSSSTCLEKRIVFKSPITLDELSFDSINDTISFADFAQKINETFQSIPLENLTAETFEAEEIVPLFINGVDFANFTKHFSSSNVIDEYIIDSLETDRLNVKFINGMPVDEIDRLKNHVNTLLSGIFNGNVSLESLQVTGRINTKFINGEAIKDLYKTDRMGTVVFKENVSIENLTILGSLNNFDFLERVSDTVLKTDQNIKVDGYKKFDVVTCNQLEAASLNGHAVENIFDPIREQELTGPVVVNGSVTIINEFNATGNIGDVPFRDLIDRFKFLGNNSYELGGNVRFLENVSVENLFTSGTIQGTDLDGFLETTIPKNEDNVTISGTKVFQSPVTFNGAFVVRDALNDIDLKRFRKAVFVDKPFSVQSKLIFMDGMKIEKDIAVEIELQMKSVMGIDVDELRLNVLYLNRPTYIKEAVTFNDVTFQSDIKVSTFNDLDMSLLIPLNSEQSLPVVLKCLTVTVDEIKIWGLVNEKSLDTIWENTFMMSGNQNITGHINFLGDVYVRRDFNARLINGIDPTMMVPLNSKSALTGEFVFEEPIVFNQGLRILGYLNGINPNRWEAVAITTNSLQQIASGRWTVLGNVHFENGASGRDTLNGTNVTELSATLAKRHLEMDARMAETNDNLNTMCQDLSQLKLHAERQIYMFSVFDYLQIIEFDATIVSLHHVELQGLDYMLVSYSTCHMHAYLFTGTRFELKANVPDFGAIDQWISSKDHETLYLLVSGTDSCGKGPVNLWKLEDDQFTHVLSLGHKMGGRMVDQDEFSILINTKDGERSFEQMHDKLEKSLSSQADDDDVRIVFKGDQMLLTSRQAIHEQDLGGLGNRSVGIRYGSPEILNFKAGVFGKDMFLYHDEEVSKDHIFICSNDVKEKKILQTIKSHRPTSFRILNFEGSIETLLVFVENRRNLQIYEYKGIQGFVYRDSIRINVDKLFSFKIRKYPNLAKRNCLALIHENRLTILEANMYGEKLDMETLTCSGH